MISFTVMYSFGQDKKFDWDYYLTKHIGIIKQGLGSRIKHIYVEKGLANGRVPDAPPAFLCILHVLVDGMEDIQEIGKISPQLFADIPNYTDADLMIQISEVID